MRPIAPYLELGQDIMREAKSAATRRAYRSDWNQFRNWCEQHDESPLPASTATIVAYLAYMAQAGRKVSTMSRALVSINLAHRSAGFEESPVATTPVKEAMKGFRRKLGIIKTKKLALRRDDLRGMLGARDNRDHLLEVRNRALLLLGFSAGFRRSELVGLQVQDLEFSEHGLIVTLRRSKTDQQGKGRRLDFFRGGALCPVRALKAWIKTAEITSGPLFRAVSWRSGRIGERGISGSQLAKILKRYIGEIGKDARLYSGHSLRRGMITGLAKAGCNELQIMARSGHRSSAMVSEYVEEAGLFHGDNVTALLGL
jgi:integrase